MYANFLLGKLNVTPAALALVGRVPLDLVAKHAMNEYGDITPVERHRNEVSMRVVGQIISRYAVDPTDASKGRVEVITGIGWESTTVRLEGETE